MGKIQLPQPVKLICGVLYREMPVWMEAAPLLEDRFGPIDFRSPEFPFVETKYYDQEMGPGIRRLYVSFRDLVSPDILADAKLSTNQLELLFADPQGNRRINLDPGTIASANLILASTKNFCHRVYLRDGIFAEVTMTYRRGEFQALPWTYPDYRDHREVFAKIRRIYREQTRKTTL